VTTIRNADEERLVAGLAEAMRNRRESIETVADAVETWKDIRTINRWLEKGGTRGVEDALMRTVPFSPSLREFVSGIGAQHHECEVCGIFFAAQAGARYCKPAHRQWAYRQRKAERE
jgi:hypothetical protein